MKFLDEKKNPALINVLWIVLDSDGSDYLGMDDNINICIID